MSSNSLRPGWNRQGFQPPPPADNTFEPPQQSERKGTTTKGRSLADLARGNISTQQQQPPSKPNTPRYTREKLLSLRPIVSEPPAAIQALIEEIRTSEAQDPVCWDTFDADEIWNANAKLRKTERPARRENSFGSSRWQRGVALPAREEKRNSSKDAETPDELWDDPQSEAKDLDAFDFEQMAENSRKLEEEMRGGSRSRSSSTEEQPPDSKVDPGRPLASAGTTIRSGSGDDVNVFEDFDEPAAPPPVVRPANEDQSASSRLMAMIGVQKEDPAIATSGSLEDKATDSSAKFISLPASEDTVTPESKTPSVEPTISSLSWGLQGSADTSTSIPLNPWGGLGAALPLQTQLAEQQRLEEEKKRAALEEQERLRRREQERLIKEQQQREAQVENVLVERISNILEASWGRSDLRSILSTLHAEDARVMSLLNSVDALRALLFRHPRRVAVRPDPSVGAEMAILLMTNAQWRAAGEQEPPVRPAAKPQELPPVNPTQPWFYSDPSKNIQGPFRGQEMRQWLEAGYFKGDLPISQNPKGPFRSLSLFFPNLSEAFKSSVAADEEAEAAARREAELRELQLEQRRESERREAVRRERERQEAERREAERRQQEELRQTQMQATAPLEPRKAQNGGDSSSAAKLKLMLGLGGDTSEQAKSYVQTTPAARPESHPQVPIPKPSKPSKVAPTPSNSTKEKPAWGGAAQPAARKSMSEIQREEARAVATATVQRPSSNGWANVAASRSTSLNTGWNAKQQHNRPVASTTTTRQPTRALSMQPQGAQRKQPMRSQSVSETPTEAFGAKMSPALEQWAKDQMKRINGTDDLTLVAFCMTLEDPEEIRQYLSAYLGPSNSVNTFATEFISRKNDDWESTARKGRKKKNNR